MRLTLPSFIVLLVLGVAISAVHADSVVWNGRISNWVCNPNSCRKHGLKDLIMQISYHMQVTNALTGEVLASGATVPEGTQVKYAFVPHDYNHIYWFAAGYNADSPYGDWIAGAAKPPGNICIPKNDVGHTRNALATYASFSVAPPTKSIAGLPAGCTTDADGISKLCTLDAPGTVSAQFNFASTRGKFYGASGFLSDPLKAVLAPPSRAELETATSCRNPVELVEARTKTSIAANSFIVDSTAPLTIDVSAQVMSHTLNVVPAPGTPEDDPTTPEDESAPTTPTQPSIAASGGAACAVGQSFSLSFSSTDPEGDGLRYLVDWNGDGSVDEFMPGAGYVLSGTSLSASRTYATEGQKTVRVRAQDENGTLSPWASLTFSCGDSTEAGMSGDGTNAGENGLLLPASPDLELRVLPSLVANGATTKVNWSARNVERCTVSGTNGDSWSGLRSSVGGESSGPITQPTFYTLSCVDREGAVHTKEAVVRVIPNWRER